MRRDPRALAGTSRLVEFLGRDGFGGAERLSQLGRDRCAMRLPFPGERTQGFPVCDNRMQAPRRRELGWILDIPHLGAIALERLDRGFERCVRGRLDLS